MMERPLDPYEQRLTLQARGVAPAASLTDLLEYYALVAGWRTDTPARDAWERTLRRFYAEVHGVVRRAVIQTAAEREPYWACLAALRREAREGEWPRTVHARALADLAVLNLGVPRIAFFSELARPLGETDEECVARRAVLMP